VSGGSKPLADLLALAEEMDATLLAIYTLDPEAHATKSRDYGRGFAEALRVVRTEIDTRLGLWAARRAVADAAPSPASGGTS
jgi:7-keto-8-aminopelargonate synthetase-like enzyme